MADELEAAQAPENGGRGVSCMRVIITYLRLGHLSLAKNVRQVDGDKIRDYPTLEKKVSKILGCRTHLIKSCITCRQTF
jgi:hypothetical protein